MHREIKRGHGNTFLARATGKDSSDNGHVPDCDVGGQGQPIPRELIVVRGLHTGSEMQELEFIGKVRSNKGKFHKDMVVPGRESLSSAPENWPLQLYPGTLNVGIDENGFPGGFDEIGTSDGVKKLDEGRFEPVFVIPQNEIVGNTLKPKPGQPRRGTAQVWRAELRSLSTDEKANCWMLRRIGSKIKSQIELVAEVHLRNELSLNDGTPVSVVIYSG